MLIWTHLIFLPIVLCNENSEPQHLKIGKLENLNLQSEILDPESLILENAESDILEYRATTPENLTNIDYVGLGYNAILGNPHSAERDPGFQQAVFELTYNNATLSSDGKWSVPDNVQVLQIPSCSYTAESDEITGALSYQNSLSVDAQVNGAYWTAKFSASLDYKNVNEGTNNYRNVYVESVAKCIQYKATIKRTIRLSTDFLQAVKNLPSTMINDDDLKQYSNFIDDYGTHYVSQVVMGAKAVIRSEFKQTAWTKMMQTGINIKAAAAASFMGFAGGASVGFGDESMLRQQFDSKRTSRYEAYLGSKPSTDGRWETWAEKTGQSPYPITYVLQPMLELFLQQYMPNFSVREINSKKNNLQSVYKNYCGQTQYCGNPEPGKVPVKMDVVEEGIHGDQVTSCRPNYSLLSCGIGNLPGGSEAEVYRTSYPSSSSSCSCYDYYGATCVAWCTNAVEGFQIQSSGERRGTFTVSCPAQSKVLGCHIQPTRSQVEVYRAYYPNDDGNSCTCYDYFGANCKASCAKNIYDYEVRKQFGNGGITVTCSDGNYVLGCGIQPVSKGAYEKWRFAKVSSISSCLCYDYFGATCFATCGKFR